MKRKWCFCEIFHTQFGYDMFYAVKSSEVELTIKFIKTEFPNVRGEYKHYSNPSIHSTTVLCGGGTVMSTISYSAVSLT